jgi:HEPN domain-containing protein
MDDERRTAVERWFVKADHDHQASKILLERNHDLTDNICFHAQQMAEKYLKAFLVYSGLHVEKIHYLPRIIELCGKADPDFHILMEDARAITDYAASGRYPDDWEEIPLAEAQAAVETAQRIMSFVKGKIKF